MSVSERSRETASTCGEGSNGAGVRAGVRAASEALGLRMQQSVKLQRRRRCTYTFNPINTYMDMGLGSMRSPCARRQTLLPILEHSLSMKPCLHFSDCGLLGQSP
jgi:hypothetical protein